MESYETPNQSIRSAERVLAIVDLLAQEPGPQNLLDIAAKLQLPRTTVHRMLTTLVGVGWVEQRSMRSGYQLTERMLGISALALANHVLVNYGRTLLTRFSERTKINSYLGVLAHRRVVLLVGAHGEMMPPYDFQAGLAHSAHANPGGKVLLAYLSPEKRRAIFPPDVELRKLTPMTLTDWDELEEQFAAIRLQGYFIDRGEHLNYRNGVAVPVFDSDGAVRAAMLCTLPIEQASQERMLYLRDELLAAAAELSSLLGNRMD